jgi:hypothetical protein
MPNLRNVASVQRAAKDGDEYVELHRLRTLATATSYANNWTPEKMEI